MNWPEIPPFGGGSGDGSGDDSGDRKRANHLQGPRPSPLSVNRVSRKIGKPPLPFPAPPYPPPRAPPQANREPVIIYAVSPKVIHTEASDFMSVVQRLTGLCSSSSSTFSGAGGPMSPAARLAVMEKASPPDRARAGGTVESGIIDLLDWEVGAVDFGILPGILSPAPENLPAVMPGMFPEVAEAQNVFGFQESLMSPWGYGGLFQGSPSSSAALFSGGNMMFSSAPSPVFDISTLFDY